uniref:Uncharacterized protein n=1 Tax=Anopheles culicifacies TaxID=139723 RepID=A0A182MLW0_9DIPT
MALAVTVRRLELILAIILVVGGISFIRSEFAIETCLLTTDKTPFNNAKRPALIYIDSAQITSFASVSDVTKNLSLIRAMHSATANELRVTIFCLNFTIVNELTKTFASNNPHLFLTDALVPGRCVPTGKYNLFFAIQYEQHPSLLYITAKVHREDSVVRDVILVLFNWHELSVTEVHAEHDPININAPKGLRQTNCSFRISFSYLIKPLKSHGTTNHSSFNTA